MPTADNPDDLEQAVPIFSCPDLCTIKDAIANIARNREVLHFLSCIARFCDKACHPILGISNVFLLDCYATVFCRE
jgi:hypothetical protein